MHCYSKRRLDWLISHSGNFNSIIFSLATFMYHSQFIASRMSPCSRWPTTRSPLTPMLISTRSCPSSWSVDDLDMRVNWCDSGSEVTKNSSTPMLIDVTCSCWSRSTPSSPSTNTNPSCESSTTSWCRSCCCFGSPSISPWMQLCWRRRGCPQWRHRTHYRPSEYGATWMRYSRSSYAPPLWIVGWCFRTPICRSRGGSILSSTSRWMPRRSGSSTVRRSIIRDCWWRVGSPWCRFRRVCRTAGYGRRGVRIIWWRLGNWWSNMWMVVRWRVWACRWTSICVSSVSWTLTRCRWCSLRCNMIDHWRSDQLWRR